MYNANRFCALLALSFFSNWAFAASLPASDQVGFTPNLGQWDDEVAFHARHDGISLFVTRGGEMVHRLAGADGKDWILVERLENARPLQPRAIGADTARITYIGAHGARTASRSDRVAIGQAWPGISVELWLDDDGFEKRFVLDAGASASAIRVGLDGVTGMHVTADGEMRLETGLGEVFLSAPVAWQEINGRQLPIEVHYAQLDGDQYGFTLGQHDAHYAVTIDPIIRSTFSGGRSDDVVYSLKATNDSVYVTGYTKSDNFPGTSGGYQPSIIRNTSLGGNVFVARYSRDLTTLTQSTYFGSYGPSSGGQSSGLFVRSMVVADDSVYLAGYAPGVGTHLPATAGALQTSAGGGEDDAFVARLSLDLTQLLQATYFGGADRDSAWPMVVTADGVYISGWSNDPNLAGLSEGAVSAPPTPSGSGAAFVAKLSRDLSSALATTWISDGGWNTDPRTMAIGDDGSIYVGGDGRPNLFQTTGAFQPAIASSSPRTDGFVVRLSADLGTIHRSTYLGGWNHERIDGLAFGEGRIYVGGNTESSSDFPFDPNAADPTHSNGSTFVAALAADLSTLDGASSFSGSNNNSTSTADIRFFGGKLFVAGTNGSSTLPGTEGGAEAENPTAGICGFAAIFNPALTSIEQATYLGCGSDRLQVFAMDVVHDHFYVAGQTRRALLPNGTDSAQPNKGGGVEDGFIIYTTTDLGDLNLDADVSIEMTGSDRRIANHYLLYDIVVGNIGPDTALDVLVQDVLPPEFSAANWICSGTGGATCANGSGSGNLGETVSIPLGGQLNYSICARTNVYPSQVINTAQVDVASHTQDPVASNNSATAIMNDPRLFADGFEGVNLPAWCPPMN